MVVGGRWAGWGRVLEHTRLYTRALFLTGLLTVVLAPVVILSMPVVLPAALCSHLLLVRLFPRVSWIREPGRARAAAAAGLLFGVAGSATWMAVEDTPPEFVSRIGPWGTVIYVLGVPVLLSNLGVLLGYLLPRGAVK